jgi:hypothetical protein
MYRLRHKGTDFNNNELKNKQRQKEKSQKKKIIMENHKNRLQSPGTSGEIVRVM